MVLSWCSHTHSVCCASPLGHVSLGWQTVWEGLQIASLNTGKSIGHLPERKNTFPMKKEVGQHSVKFGVRPPHCQPFFLQWSQAEVTLVTLPTIPRDNRMPSAQCPAHYAHLGKTLLLSKSHGDVLSICACALHSFLNNVRNGTTGSEVYIIS